MELELSTLDKKMPTYMIIKKIKVDAETLEEALQNHANGKTMTLNAEEMGAHPAPQRNMAPPPNQGRPLSIRNPGRP